MPSPTLLFTLLCSLSFFAFFLNDTLTTVISSLSLHDALPIFRTAAHVVDLHLVPLAVVPHESERRRGDGGEDQQVIRSEEHTSELQSRFDLVCRLLLEKKKAGQLLYNTL